MKLICYLGIGFFEAAFLSNKWVKLCDENVPTVGFYPWAVA